MIQVRPFITEKSVKLAEMQMFTVLVDKDASKSQIDEAIKTYFNVNPISIKTITKKQLLRTKLRKLSADRGFKKAIIKLKKGEMITGFEIAKPEEKKEKVKKDKKEKEKVNNG